ncbi:hypothetical protein [Cellulosilyticum sp. I15G10I2]|uniref:hypothetical protein n=1 Tax=Cellulosilyticum sp. I15G10I2 TaxID=1892843 RepID=UPI00085C4967|nr:hypothetical protein [Cellulosilyticum sp. I15G10I2]
MNETNLKSFKHTVKGLEKAMSLFQIHIMEDMKQRAKHISTEVGYPRQEEFLEHLNSLETIEQVKECISDLTSWYMGEYAVITVKKVKDEMDKKGELKNE